MAGQVASPKLTPNVDGYESTPLESVGDLSKDAQTFMKENRFKKKKRRSGRKTRRKNPKDNGTSIHSNWATFSKSEDHERLF